MQRPPRVRKFAGKFRMLSAAKQPRNDRRQIRIDQVGLAEHSLSHLVGLWPQRRDSHPRSTFDPVAGLMIILDHQDDWWPVVFYCR